MADKDSLNKNFPEDYGKAVAPGYEPASFFFRQFNEELGTRIVVWAGELGQMKRAVFSFLSRFPDEVEVLLKVEDENAERDDGQPCFRRYHGEVRRELLLEAVRHHERYIFLNGHHQFCVRCRESGEYFAYDEDGILWLYPNVADEWVRVLLGNGFSESKPQKLLGAFPHWQYTPADSDKMCESLIQGLGLKDIK
jgi:hypothetical protein